MINAVTSSCGAYRCNWDQLGHDKVILVTNDFVHKVRQSSIYSERVRPLIASVAFKAAGNPVLLFDLFPFIKKDLSYRRRCRNAMNSIVQRAPPSLEAATPWQSSA